MASTQVKHTPGPRRSRVEAMSFTQHLGELRKRLAYSCVALFITAFACMSFSAELFKILQVPLASVPAHQMIVLSPLELIITYIKLALMSGLFISMPWLLLQLWLFIAPGLHTHEKKWIIPFIAFGTLFFLAGGAFAYFIVLPYGFEYLVGMVPESISAQYSVAIYFALVIRLLLAFALIFEVPLVMWILAAAGIIAPQTLAQGRKYWMVVAVVLGALLTPPDPITQLMMAIPLMVFFELGLIGARLLYPHRRPQRDLKKSSPLP